MTDELEKKERLSQFHRNNVSFITFNYDRSLEHFLFESLRYSFSEIPKDEIINEVKQIKIIHIYDKVAPLPWQDEQEGVEYKPKVSEGTLKTFSRNLHYYPDLVAGYRMRRPGRSTGLAGRAHGTGPGVYSRPRSISCFHHCHGHTGALRKGPACHQDHGPGEAGERRGGRPRERRPGTDPARQPGYFKPGRAIASRAYRCHKPVQQCPRLLRTDQKALRTEKRHQAGPGQCPHRV